ncbi:MAG TPA: hypothetical protein VE994_19210 [Terriglobales bacterium]|nr:hypothetical protein [Terriglobales bacterium]
MLVFRENRVAVATHLLARTLAEPLASTDREALLDALLRAGELECSLADAGSPAAAQVAAVTDALARHVVNGRSYDAAALIRSLGSLKFPAQVKISPPEGFAYYALHPLSYAELALECVHQFGLVAVIGIRSIGTTLSAVVAAAFRGRGVPAERISVRPTGHPFDRITRFTDEELCWVERERDAGAHFFVVDEGPGLSGSSFLSVGEALLRAGVQRAKVTFLCSHEPNPDMLRAYDGAERWSGFRACAIGANPHVPAAAANDLGAGKWRELLYADTEQWPASWLQMERVKFLSADKRTLFKFEGLGRFGTAVYDRLRAIADAGFGPEPQLVDGGFVASPWIAGTPGDPSHISESLLNRLADYCAFRAREFRTHSRGNQANLAEMVRCNMREEFGFEPDLDDAVLECETPVVVDGRMQPHEWLRSDGGVWLKVDGGSHGDDHFYPGPTDIAWDLAGTIIEWQLDHHSEEYFLSRYRRISADDAARRLPCYLRAYSAFRLGYCKMAAESMDHGPERERLIRGYHRYRRLLSRQLRTGRSAAQISGERLQNVARGARSG